MASFQAQDEGSSLAAAAAAKQGATPSCAALKYVREHPVEALAAPCPRLDESSGARLAWLTAHHGPNRVGRFLIERRREGLHDATYAAYLERAPTFTAPAAALEAGAVAAAACGGSGEGEARDGSCSAPPRDVLLWSKKWRKSLASQYVISTDLEDLASDRQKRGAGYIGKLKVSVWRHCTTNDNVGHDRLCLVCVCANSPSRGSACTPCTTAGSGATGPGGSSPP